MDRVPQGQRFILINEFFNDVMIRKRGIKIL